METIIDRTLVKPNSPEHIDYFLGWIYRGGKEFKQLIWNMIEVENKKRIEGNEHILFIDYEKKKILIKDAYDDFPHVFFAYGEWCLEVTFEKFKEYICLYEIDYNKYYQVKEDCEFALEMLEVEGKTLSRYITPQEIDTIKNQLKDMQRCMDLTDFIPDYHKWDIFTSNKNDIFSFLYNLAKSYMTYAKPFDIISFSKLRWF